MKEKDSERKRGTSDSEMEKRSKEGEKREEEEKREEDDEEDDVVVPNEYGAK